MAPSTAHLEVSYDNGTSVVGRFGNVVFSLTTGRGESAGYEAGEAMMARVDEEYADGWCMLVAAAAGAGMPTSEGRARSQATTARYADRLRGMAIVLEGDGLWMSSMRMVSQTMMMALASRQGFPKQIFGTLAEASSWLETSAGSAAHFEADALREAIESARTRSAA